MCNHVFDLARSCDASAESEPLGLIPSHPTLRPADILTSAAVSGRLAALDVGIVSPEATGSGLNCVNAMQATKRARYARHREELARENVVYEPMVWSAFGRPHPRAVELLRLMAKRVARRRGLANSEQIYRRTAAKIGVEVWRRAAQMVAQCMPCFTEDEETSAGEVVDLGKSEPPESAADPP